MARFLAWADLHDEFWNRTPVVPQSARDVDAVLLAGDTSTHGRHLAIAEHLWREIEKPVIMVYGNHEFYHERMDELLAQDVERLAELRAEGVDIRILQGEATEVAGTRIIGATLWTDLDLFPGYARETRDAVSMCLNDFNLIRITGDRHMRIEDWLELHWRDRERLVALAREPFDGPTFVMTHHMPVKDMIHPMRQLGDIKRQFTNAGFAADMAGDLSDLPIDGWFCGHSHDNHSVEICGANGPFRIYTNSRGYPKEGCDFDPGFIIETGQGPEPGL